MGKEAVEGFKKNGFIFLKNYGLPETEVICYLVKVETQLILNQILIAFELILMSLFKINNDAL